jgi:predicted GNAT superfamily acetyltransferase
VASLTELADVVHLFTGVWGTSRPPVTVDLLRAFTKAGNYVAGAYVGQTLAGACVGFFHEPSDDALHSHVAAVAAEHRGRGVGFALKMHQRTWVADRGVGHITWTYDPLIRRNAHFNLVKLGARAVEYLPNFYGTMGDQINGDDDSDRLLVRWAVHPGEALPEPADPAEALMIGPDGFPHRGSLDAGVLRVAVPPDIDAIRRDDPARARDWRRAVRDTLGELLKADGVVTGFDASGHYLVTRALGRTPS